MEKTKKILLKLLKWLGIFIASVLLLMFLIPLLFPGTISEQVKIFANKKVAGKLDYKAAHLTFFRHFPSLTVSVDNLILRGSIPFQDDTFIGATTVFGEIQESINLIWQVKPKPKVAWIKLLKDRLLSVSMIVTLGFLLLVSFLVNGALLALSSHLETFLPAITVTFFNVLISFIVIAVLFGVIFKVLPDAHIKWRDVRSGAVFTAVFLMLGRLVIGLYISNTSSSYGAAGSLIVILLWVYYTAAILYFGADFTRAYADFYGIRIEPAEFGVHIETREEAKDVKVVPPKHDIGKSK